MQVVIAQKNMNRGRGLGIAALAGTTLAGITIAAGFIGANPLPAAAQAAYGSYVGIGPSFGLTSGGRPNEGSRTAAVVSARYKFLEIPISARAQVLLFSGTTAVVPTVSYDFPINWQTDVYIGAGYSFSDGNDPSPLGNRNSIVIQPGIDYVLPNSNLVLFGNAIYALDAYKSGGSAVSVQGGVGLRF
ncbi:MAG: hypothetical protein SFW36_21910 [Leptolyngbyaceae cyanobacterium bins.59]|nr:hypothetical protein [Leptolyngbyaceae cyanobacterium bins.59]